MGRHFCSQCGDKRSRGSEIHKLFGEPAASKLCAAKASTKKKLETGGGLARQREGSVLRKPRIFTIGHSTRSLDEFVELLRAHGVRGIVDVRSIPRSLHNPQFNSDTLRRSLERRHMSYKHIKELGGLRHARKDSQNCGWRNASFRGFADYMATAEFSEGLESLIKIADARETAMMCAEALPWRCHRSLIGDALTKKGWLVRDIMSRTVATRHLLTTFLKMRKGQLVYPADLRQNDVVSQG
jgi:uncharacterized protein (DUF488 family)